MKLFLLSFKRLKISKKWKTLICLKNDDTENIILYRNKFTIYRRFNAIVSQLKMHYFSEGAFEILIASQLLKKEKYI